MLKGYNICVAHTMFFLHHSETNLARD